MRKITDGSTGLRGSTGQTYDQAGGVRAWWRESAEPMLLGVMGLLVGTLPLLVLAEVLSLQTGLRLLVGLIWLAGLLLLPRLPRLLHQERRRTGMLVGVALAAGVAMLLAHPGTPALPEPIQAEAAQAEAAQTLPAPGDGNGSGASSEAALVAALSAETAAAGTETAATETRHSVLAQSGSPTFVSPPRISRHLFAKLLQDGTAGMGTSPAAPYADELYDIIVSYGLDPAIALAFFAQESSFCTTGMCVSHDMHNWGGQRAAVNPNRVVGVVHNSTGPFVIFGSWQDGVRDWCELILYRYVNKGLDTVARAIPVYAPAFDGNNVQHYIDSVHRRVAVWQGQDPDLWVEKSVSRYPDLPTGLMMESFLATELEYHPTWAFHQYVMEEGRAGRPLGSPLADSKRIAINGRMYAIQVYALDTLYTPIASIENQTNWSDVRRLSTLLLEPQAAQQ